MISSSTLVLKRVSAIQTQEVYSISLENVDASLGNTTIVQPPNAEAIAQISSMS
jgi:hypothetical protein